MMKKGFGHTFISYSHQNNAFKNKIVDLLQAADIPYWFDADGMEAGTRWKPQIDTAVDESFAMVVIVTPESMKSPYVTYEWARALGSGVSVFPLLLAGSFDDVHERLREEHCVDCRDNIPDSVIAEIEAEAKVPPDIYYLGDVIRQIISPMRVYLRLLLWLYPRINKESPEERLVDVLHRKAGAYSEKISSRDLPMLLVNNIQAFTVKYRRIFRELIEVTSHLSSLINAYLDLSARRLQEKEYFEAVAYLYELRWLPLAEQADPKYSLVQALDDWLGVLDTTKDVDFWQDRLSEIYKDDPVKRESDHLFDSDDESNKTREILTRNAAYVTLQKTLRDPKVFNEVWELISDLRRSGE